MTQLEQVRAFEAHVTEPVKAIIASNLTLNSNNFCDGLLEIFDFFANKDLAIDELVVTEKIEKGYFDFLATLHPSTEEVNLDELISQVSPAVGFKPIAENLTLVRIEGSGFTRSQNFSARLYSELGKEGANILAQTASDVEMALYFAAKDAKAVFNALGAAGIRVRLTE